MSIITADTKDILIVTAKGYVNRLTEDALPRMDRARAGSKVIKLSKGDNIVGIYACTRDAIVRCYHYDGTFTDIESHNMEVGSSVSPGNKILKEVVKTQLVKL